MQKEKFTQAEIELYRNSIDRALRIGEKLLIQGASAMDAVVAVIVELENDSLFNAGKGAVLTSEGHAELDASIMDGRSKNCGAVTGLQNIKNPIKAARSVMDSSKHVFFSGAGARAFAMERGLEWVDSSYFETDRRLRQHLKMKSMVQSKVVADSKFGTVGCVALDVHGDLAAGTSTGGMSMKRHGRIGDSPVIGAGTYADNSTCAVSCSGWGEYFIRAVVAHDVHARMAYGNSNLAQASREVIQNVIPKMGGNGGLIAVDRFGNVSLEFNTSGMFRASSNSNGERSVAIFREE
jgi:beta-aspartyl-peptidase (threonine type)